MRYDERNKTGLENLNSPHRFSIYYLYDVKQDIYNFLSYWIKMRAMSNSQGYKDQIK